MDEKARSRYKSGSRWGRSQQHAVRLTPEDADLLNRVSLSLRKSKTAVLEEGLHLVAQKHQVPLRVQEPAPLPEGYQAPE